MDKKIELNTLAITVKTILTNHPATRNDDYLLYSYYLNSCGISEKTSYKTIRLSIKAGTISGFESVGRSRRKIQELYPTLAASDTVKRARKKQIKSYKEFNKESNING